MFLQQLLEALNHFWSEFDVLDLAENFRCQHAGNVWHGLWLVVLYTRDDSCLLIEHCQKEGYDVNINIAVEFGLGIDSDGYYVSNIVATDVDWIGTDGNGCGEEGDNGNCDFHGEYRLVPLLWRFKLLLT